MPDIRITVDGRPALTTAQAAARRGITPAGMRRLLSHHELQPCGHLDDRTPLYDEKQLTTALPPARTRTDLKETPMRTWTLSANCPAGRLQAMVQEYFPGQITPGVTDGAWATVNAVGDADSPPQWMQQLADEYSGVVDTTIE